MQAIGMKGGTFWGVFAMGVLSALIVGPCVAAPLAGALLYINKSRDALLGGSALFSMALGMGVPLLAVGLSAGTLMPRAGAWMQTVKNFFGVVLLGMAVWIISPVIPQVAHMLLWAGLLIVSAIYLHALDPLPQNASGFRKLWKGVGVISLLVGVALLLGALAGGRDILQPLSGLHLASGAAGREWRQRPSGLPNGALCRGIGAKGCSGHRKACAPRLLRGLVRVLQGDGALHFYRPCRSQPNGPHAPAKGGRHR